jgi:sulfur dioxygenase
VIFRQLFDASSCTYTYLLADDATREAVLIDTVFEQHARDAALVRELELELLATLDTHCHADHVSGAWRMKKTFGSRIAMAKVYGAKNVDIPLDHEEHVMFGRAALEVRATPGHTDGCLSFVLDSEAMAFTGDALLVRGAGRTDFQNGSAHRLFRSIREQLFTLSDACVVYPGHDYEGRTSSTIGEEKRFNPRIGGGAREEDFVGYMDNLGLPHPKQLAVSLPANMRAGEPEADIAAEPSWAPIVTTYAGLWEIEPSWVAQHRKGVVLLDVRQPHELAGELGKLEGAVSIPLDALRERACELSRDTPIVAVCQTGKRSGMATVILRKLGFEQVANLAGGMVRWRDLGLSS